MNGAVKPVLIVHDEPAEVTRAVVDGGPSTVQEALEVGAGLVTLEPYVGKGRTADLWEALATLGARDLALARAIEPHLDAVTILDQAGQRSERTDRFGVFAAEGPGVRLAATPAGPRWQLDGTKPWCSLAGMLSHALITAWVDDDRRQLFRVDLRQPGVEVEAGAWSALGLREIPSGPVRFDDVMADPVGDPGWYLQRPGFAWGGISVAACWFGGAVGIGRRLLEAARRRSADDQLLMMHLGAVDARLAEARCMLADAAARIDAASPTAQGDAGDLLAQRVRSTVARSCEAVIRHVGHALGPGPLANDAEHAKQVADLELYVRQHHAERDDASQGRRVRGADDPW
ncbi:acyl-CoA dehydrogenase [Microlunatus endophyticus]|uniref:Acyl-CoA dehydrogenase n=2 Tax=Microlunatus endophyticus TaxID=1716077 RepID=A0A917SF08_9ACTN|nr:acyl-CoA dehydrogenase [Microlunatus endophyticus]